MQTVQRIQQESSASEEITSDLRTYNEDYVCWLEMTEPSIELPVVKTSNNSYYLNHAIDGSENDYGTPFFASSTKMNDDVRVIYGHHIYYDDAAMFSPLLKLVPQEEGSFSLISDSGEEEYDITHVMHVPKTECSFAMSKHEFSSDADFTAWISYADVHNAWSSMHSCTRQDSYVLLQTCDADDGHFLVVIGKKRFHL